MNLFPSRSENSATALVNGWWIPCAIRTLALFSKYYRGGRRSRPTVYEDVTNEHFHRRWMRFDEFIIDLLDGVDIEFEYDLWLRKQHG